MGYSEALIDDFNDNSFSTTTWTTPNGTTGITETGAQLHMVAEKTTPATVQSSATFDLTNHILAVKWRTPTGTSTSSVKFYLVVNDASNNRVFVYIAPTGNIQAIGAAGAATGSEAVLSGSGTAWADNTWVGLGMMGNDNVIHAYKSTDNGVTWSEFARLTVGGTFTKTAVHLNLQSVFTTTTEAPTLTVNIDEAAAWTRSFRSILIDGFDDGSLDTGIWTTFGAAVITESGGKVSIPADVSYPTMISPTNFDLTTGILAVQLYQSGTGTSSCECDIKVTDNVSSGNGVQVNFQAGANNAWIIQAVGSATISNDQYSLSAEFGTAWPNGQWLGLGYVGADNVLTIFKSSDAVTWTEIGCATIGGTFNKNSCGLSLTNGYYDTTQHPTFVASFDNASKFSLLPAPSGGNAKVRVGGAWVTATAKVRVGGAWVTATPKRRVGGAWV